MDQTPRRFRMRISTLLLLVVIVALSIVMVRQGQEIVRLRQSLAQAVKAKQIAERNFRRIQQLLVPAIR